MTTFARVIEALSSIYVATLEAVRAASCTQSCREFCVACCLLLFTSLASVMTIVIEKASLKELIATATPGTVMQVIATTTTLKVVT